MTATKQSGPAVSAKVHPNGDVSLGVTIDGTHVPLHVTPAFRVEQLRENAAERDDNGSDDTEGGSQ